MGEDWVEILDPSEKKPHSKLGIASCVAFFFAMLIHFLNISERFNPSPWGGRPCAGHCAEEWRLYFLVADIEIYSIIGFWVIGVIIGIISLFNKSKNRLFGFIGIVINLIPAVFLIFNLNLNW